MERAETFSRLDSIQTRSLARLQEAGTDRALLVELLEGTCLLELAKIETTRVDPASYLQYAVDVVAQMYPVHGMSRDGDRARIRTDRGARGRAAGR